MYAWSSSVKTGIEVGKIVGLLHVYIPRKKTKLMNNEFPVNETMNCR